MNEEKPINKPIKKVQFFEAKQHIEIIRQVKGETAHIPRSEQPSKLGRKK